MEDHLQAFGVLTQDLQRVVVGLACVDHDGLRDPTRELDLGDEGALLIAARGAVAVVVKAGGGERQAARSAVGADGEHLRDPGFERRLNEHGVVRPTDVQMGVAVDHGLGNSGVI